MKISYQWLREYVTHPWTPDELADRLTMAGLEVESVDPIGQTFDGVVVGHVLDVRPHPGADRLTVCSVDLGTGEPVQIVCGAPNVAKGQLAPVATVGTTLELPDRSDPTVKKPVTLSRAKIRGEESNGMICAEDELGLSNDHSGIMVLDGSAKVGEPFAEWLDRAGRGSSDFVIDVSITPNRPDAVSHIGIARDVAALAGVELHPPAVEIPAEGGTAASSFSVDIEAPDGCHRYVGLLVRDVTIAESPDWLKQRLIAIGLRPRNNVVDITNYVMYECGQPLHAFDFDQLADRRIVVRRTKGDTTFTTLDSKERTLPHGTLMIADGERDVAIAGVMGGENSEVTGATRHVLIESAWFEPSGIRRTAKSLGLQSDASYRFERGIDSDLQAWAAARAAQLIVELGGGTLVDGMADARPVRTSTRSIDVRASRITLMLGTEVPASEVERLLAAIGFRPRSTSGGWTVDVPSWRPDVEREIDVIEEVARLWGLDSIPEPEASRVPHANVRTVPERTAHARVADLLVGYGFREIYTNSLLRKETGEAFRDPSLRGGESVGPLVETLNPISQEMAALRPSLLPGALQVIAHNLNHGQAGVRLFETGTVFDRNGSQDEPVSGYRERTMLLIAMSGQHDAPGWDRKSRAADVFDVRGVVEALVDALGLPRVRFEVVEDASDLMAHALRVRSGKTVIGTIADVAPALCDRYDLRSGVSFAELELTAMARIAASRGVTRYREISRFPVVDRDIAVLVPDSAPVGPMLDTIRKTGGDLLRSADVFDIFRDRKLGDHMKSVAFAMRFGADRTLRDEDVDRAVSRIVTALERDHAAALRS